MTQRRQLEITDAMYEAAMNTYVGITNKDMLETIYEAMWWASEGNLARIPPLHEIHNFARSNPKTFASIALAAIPITEGMVAVVQRAIAKIDGRCTQQAALAAITAFLADLQKEK